MDNLTSIFFGNLPKEFTVEQLKTIVQPFGVGYNMRIIPPKDKDLPPYGFVDMTHSEANLLLDYFSTNLIWYNGTRIHIKKAKTEISSRSRCIEIKKKRRANEVYLRKQKRLLAEGLKEENDGEA